MKPYQYDEGGIGAIVLNGGPSNDTLDGGIGNDTYIVDIANNRVVKLTGVPSAIDTVQSGVISLNLAKCANVERARLTGAAALDLTGLAMVNLLIGNDVADIPAGGQGHDTLQGGTGKDVLTGGLGSDVFFFTAKGVAGFGDTRGRITEFASGTDKPDFHSFMVDGDFTGNAFFCAGHGPQVRHVAFTGLLTGDAGLGGNGRCPSSDGPYPCADGG